jgi:hypothetical protein
VRPSFSVHKEPGGIGEKTEKERRCFKREGDVMGLLSEEKFENKF